MFIGNATICLVLSKTNAKPLRWGFYLTVMQNVRLYDMGIRTDFEEE